MCHMATCSRQHSFACVACLRDLMDVHVLYQHALLGRAQACAASLCGALCPVSVSLFSAHSSSLHLHLSFPGEGVVIQPLHQRPVCGCASIRVLRRA